MQEGGKGNTTRTGGKEGSETELVAKAYPTLQVGSITHSHTELIDNEHPHYAPDRKSVV